ncbi:MAG: MBL fold metallo-hydrolase [Candidatus Lokiarchaeota archaeon]|nr:MBL fold metallo-hydrolase [Candidatus Lokiarchaeota archaeon]
MTINIENSTCDEVKITVICDNYADVTFSEDIEGVVLRKPQGMRCIGEHGLALYLEIKSGDKSTNILFDTGSIKKSFLVNTQELAINLQNTQHLVISHGHFDHIGAILDAIEKMPKAEVWLHPKIDTKYQALRQGEFELPEGKTQIDKNEFRKLKKQYPMVVSIKMLTSLDVLKEKIESVNAKLNEFEGMKNIFPGVFIYNTINYFYEFERPKGFLIQENDMFSYADYAEETYIAINVKDKGWIILAGCSHSGILNAIETIQRTFNQPIYAVIGGFHLFKIDEARKKATIDYFKKINPRFIIPMHCTSRTFYESIKQEMPKNVINSAVGTVFNL